MESRRADFEGAEGYDRKPHQEAGQFRTQTLPPVCWEDRVPNRRHTGHLEVRGDAAQDDEPSIGLKCGNETMMPARCGWYLAEFSCLFGGAWPLDPEEGSGHLCVRVQQFPTNSASPASSIRTSSRSDRSLTVGPFAVRRTFWLTSAR
jgi:hypothetical protein